MIHPFVENLDQLKDNEIEERLTDLNKRFYSAYRLGKPELLTQIDTFRIIYREELSKRLRAKTQSDLDTDLDQLINVN